MGRHGWSSGAICQSFVVEAAMGDSSWTPLLTASNAPLASTDPVVYNLPKLAGDDRFFNRFRIRMTGPTSTNSWYLMLGWFDFFGSVRHGSFCRWYEQVSSKRTTAVQEWEVPWS